MPRNYLKKEELFMSQLSNRKYNVFFDCTIAIFFLMSFIKVFTLLDDSNVEYLNIANISFFYLKIILIFLLLMNILMTIKKYHRNELFTFISVILFLVTYEIFAGRYVDFALIVLIAFSVQDDSKPIFKAILYGLTFGIALDILLISTGYITNYIGGLRFGETTRYAYGFYGLMIFGRIIRVIAMCHVLIVKKPKYLHMLIIILFALFAYSQTGTRSEFLTVIIIYIVAILYRFIDLKVLNKSIYIIGSALLWILPLLSIYFGKFYDKIPFLIDLNQYSTGRFQYSGWLWNTLSPHLFGNRNFKFFNGLQAGDIGYFYNFVDNGWDQLILIQGIVSTSIVLITIQLLLNSLLRRKLFMDLVLVLITVILFTISQSVLFDIILNPMLIKLGLIFKKEVSNE